MTPTVTLDALRRQAILSSLAGFPFLLAFGLAWIAAGVASYFLPREIAPWVYPFLGLPATAVAIALERRMGYVPAPKPDPLLPLAMLINFIQIAAFPAYLIVWDQKPEYMPAAFAAVVGAHFLPFQWLYRTGLYLALGVLVALGPFALVIVSGDRALHYTGFLVGGVLLAGAILARSHARRIWRGRAQTAPPRQNEDAG